MGNIFKSVAWRLKMAPEDIRAISGHSIRVGATQDLLALNNDLASVMEAGRWKSHRIPMRYGEHVMAGLGGMARESAASTVLFGGEAFGDWHKDAPGVRRTIKASDPPAEAAAWYSMTINSGHWRRS